MRWRRDTWFSHFFLKYMVANMPTSKPLSVVCHLHHRGAFSSSCCGGNRASSFGVKRSTPFFVRLLVHHTLGGYDPLRVDGFCRLSTLFNSDSKHEHIDTSRYNSKHADANLLTHDSLQSPLVYLTEHGMRLLGQILPAPTCQNKPEQALRPTPVKLLSGQISDAYV